MNAEPNRWRRWAVRLAQHASSVLPGVRSPWAEAMRRELDYIGDDPAALRWALGCVLASYRTRLTHRLRFSALPTWRQVAASGALMLMIGLAFEDNAGGQTAPPQPAFDQARCDQSRSEAIQAAQQGHDRERFHRHTNADARPVVCHSDCADPLPPDITDVCKPPDTPRSR